MTRKRNDDALTDDEVAALRHDRTPDLIRQFVSRQHDQVGVRTSAYRKVANAAKAEYDALMAVALVQVAKLRTMADWFDTYDAIVEQVIFTLDGGPTIDGKALVAVRGKEVQDDLRRWADEFDCGDLGYIGSSTKEAES